MAAFDWLLMCTAAGIWGSSFLFMEVALEAEPPGLAAGLRPGRGLCFLPLVPSARRPVDAADRPAIALLGILWMALPLSLFPLAQTWIDSSVTGMLNSGMPVMTLVAGAVLFGVSTHRVQVAGVVVGILGMLMIGLSTASMGDTGAVGVVLVVLAVSCYGVAANIAGPLQRRYGSPAVLIRVLGVAAVATTPWGLFGLARSSFTWSAAAANVAVGVGGTGIAYVAAATLLGRVGPVRMSAVTYGLRVGAAGRGGGGRGEVLGRWEVAGAVVRVAGAWLTTRAGS